MGPTRFPNGQALGFVNNFNYRGTTAGLFTQGDTTPDVTLGSIFYTNNTQDTVITHFDLTDYTNRAVDYEGKIITVFFLDNSSRLANGGRLFLEGSDDLLGATHSITLMHSRSAWYELNRSRPSQTSDFVTFSEAGSSAFTVTRQTRYILWNATQATILAGISGPSYIGQRLSILMGTQGLTLQVKSSPTIALPGTNALVYTSQRALEFVRVAGSWLLYGAAL